MSVDHNEKYIFEAEWYDKIATTLKKFYLYYYPYDNTVELVIDIQFSYCPILFNSVLFIVHAFLSFFSVRHKMSQNIFKKDKMRRDRGEGLLCRRYRYNILTEHKNNRLRGLSYPGKVTNKIAKVCYYL